MKYQFIEQHKQSFPLWSCAACSRVSESGYYAWRKRPLCQRQREDADLKQKIRQVFVTYQGRYGSPRVLRELRDDGINCSEPPDCQADAARRIECPTQTTSSSDHQKRQDSSSRPYYLKSGI